MSQGVPTSHRMPDCVPQRALREHSQLAAPPELELDHAPRREQECQSVSEWRKHLRETGKGELKPVAGEQPYDQRGASAFAAPIGEALRSLECLESFVLWKLRAE
jgi:hypothetical protein